MRHSLQQQMSLLKEEGYVGFSFTYLICLTHLSVSFFLALSLCLKAKQAPI